MKQILCFGDSNTWGLIPGTKERYPWGIRWTSLLQEKLKDEDVRILEEGLCGRTTVFEDRLRPCRRGLDLIPVLLESYAPLDAAVLMLGTNDCKALYHASAQVIGKGVSLCIDALKKSIPAERILLVSPIALGNDVWRPEKDPEFDLVSIKTSRELKEIYEAKAREQEVAFLAASDFTEASPVDDEHLSSAGHEKLSEAIYHKLLEMKLSH